MKNKYLLLNWLLFFWALGLSVFNLFYPSDISVNWFIGLYIIFGISFLILNFYYYKDLKTLYKIGKDFDIISDQYYTLETSKSLKFHETSALEKSFKKLLLGNNLQKKERDEFLDFKSKFLSKELYYELGLRGLSKIDIGSFKMKKVVILFLDIVGFATIVEQISPKKALFLLNLYFEGIWEILHKYNGYIDKFLWDGMMVMFDEEHVVNSIKASIEINEFIEKFKIWEIQHKIQVGIGINFWEVILWTIGTKHRMEATVIWDTINTASRIQALTRKYKCKIIIWENVFKNLTNKEMFLIKSLWWEDLKWKQNRVILYQVEPYYII